MRLSADILAGFFFIFFLTLIVVVIVYKFRFYKPVPSSNKYCFHRDLTIYLDCLYKNIASKEFIQTLQTIKKMFAENKEFIGEDLKYKYKEIINLYESYEIGEISSENFDYSKYLGIQEEHKQLMKQWKKLLKDENYNESEELKI